MSRILNVSAELTYNANDSNITFAKSGNRAEEKIKFKVFVSEEHGEETLIKVCRTALDYAKQNGFNNIVFDIDSFTNDSADVPYIINIIIEEFSDICGKDKLDDITVTILFADNKCNEGFLNELEEDLAKPIMQTVNQAYGDCGDPLKEQFYKFQKELSKRKTFREYLVDLMNKRGVRKGSEVYKPAGVSKSTFSKIINFSINPPYKPSKETVAALSIGLKLGLKEAEEFYMYAGFHLGETEFIDKVIRFFISKKIYNIYDVNCCMIDNGYPPLGEKSRSEKIDIRIK